MVSCRSSRMSRFLPGERMARGAEKAHLRFSHRLNLQLVVVQSACHFSECESPSPSSTSPMRAPNSRCGFRRKSLGASATGRRQPARRRSPLDRGRRRAQSPISRPLASASSRSVHENLASALSPWRRMISPNDVGITPCRSKMRNAEKRLELLEADALDWAETCLAPAPPDRNVDVCARALTISSWQILGIQCLMRIKRYPCRD